MILIYVWLQIAQMGLARNNREKEEKKKKVKRKITETEFQDRAPEY